jgi:CelD/BcsL family acetyltransferase involved in cellulose biosynthesis
MRVDLIDTPEAFEKLESSWNRVQAADPDAGYFLSWRWLDVVFRANPGRWRVLAIRPEDEPGGYVGFLPLRLDLRWSRSRVELQTKLEAAGRLSWAQYTGFMCVPEWDEKALVGLASALKMLPWSRFSLKNWLVSDHRRALFLSAFAPDDYEVSDEDRARAEGEIDNRVCPFVPLPDSYDEYLMTRVSSNTRQKIRRFSRKVERSADQRVTSTSPDRFDTHLDALLELWLRKWAPTRGQASAERAAGKYREILGQSMACDAVFMPMFWSAGTLLGGLVNVVDRLRGVMYFIVAARDEDASEPFIGLVLHAHAIRWAIENNLRTYDLCHGNEPYKYSLGATDRRIEHLKIRRRSHVEIGRLDPVNVADGQGKMLELLATGRVDDAVSVGRQLATLCRSSSASSVSGQIKSDQTSLTIALGGVGRA